MKKILSIVMVMILLTTTSFAAFSDLPKGHWAKGVVEEMVDAGIISGYTDGTFRPTKPISKIEGLILISRIAGLNKYQNEANKFLEKYTSTLSKYTTKFKKDIAYLLGVGVLKESDLEDLISSSKINSPLSREEMAILVTKVLGKEAEALKNSIVVLPFKDTSSISAKAKPYVYYVYSNKIMGGMTNDTFAPKTSLTRAQAAAVLQRIYKKVTIKPATAPEEKPTNPSATSFVTGTITKIDTNASSVWIASNGKTEEYEYSSKTKFYVNSKEVPSSAMRVHADVIITVTDDLYIASMSITDGEKDTSKTVKGTIYAASSMSKTITIESDGKRTAYKYDSSTKYTLDGKSSTLLSSIKKDYEITASVDATNHILKADVKTPKKRIVGEIIDASTKYGYVVIEDEDGDEYILMDDYIGKYDQDYENEDEDYYFDDDTDFEYNGSSRSYSSIAKTSYLYNEGYYLAINLGKGDYINLVEVASKKSYLDEDEKEDNDKDEIIGEIFEADDDIGYIVIEDVDSGKEYIIMDDEIGDYNKDYDDESEDFYFNEDTDFYYEGDDRTYSKIATTSYLYDEGKYVRIVLGKNDYIEELEVASKESRLEGSSNKKDETLSSEDMLDDNYLVGEITDLYDDEITIETDDGEEYVIDVLRDAIFLDYTDDDPSNDYFDFVDAYDDEDILEGDRVIVILCGKEETALVILAE